ncbi:hypothetical protein KOI35_40865 [Actinoplanes bogorensis]|uniref:Uncharacterized protein n=1 Tax=Paractinoplanes bogorensis TaxID=1610840 RepID=A0ABS5Z2F8_9ACTN|nr:hypothetical protein [Actinoplanes bogorensis]MBU2669882.1 hypothetical protein [Actinoplanes bogorensis]
MTALLIANLVAAVASVGFALIGAFRPAALNPTDDRFYGWMYATRGVPLGVAAGLAPYFGSGPVTALLLFAAAAAQLGDAVIGVAYRKWTMIAGATLLAVIHIAMAFATL